jgi:hypothetical protein
VPSAFAPDPRVSGKTIIRVGSVRVICGPVRLLHFVLHMMITCQRVQRAS